MGRDDQDEKNGTSCPGWDVLVRDGGAGAGLTGHLLFPHEPTHPLNLLDLLFYNIKYFKVPKICILTSGLQVTAIRTKLYSLADTSFVLLDVTCSPHGIVVHMQIFAT